MVLLTEFVGTLLFCMSLNLNVEADVQMPMVLFCILLFTGDVSGGHINPGVTMAVFIEQCKPMNLFYMIAIILAQAAGAIVSVFLGFLLRVTIPVPGVEGAVAWIPNVTGFYPKLAMSVAPASALYQIILAEFIGSFMFYFVILHVKRDCKDPFIGCLAVTLSLYGASTCFTHISGGLLNPALAFMCIIWSNLTYQYDVGATQSNWNFIYSIVYLAAPMAGGFVAGMAFNFKKLTFFNVQTAHQNATSLELSNKHDTEELFDPNGKSRNYN
jgi:glycerol uptake facilitator-like aquaporin